MNIILALALTITVMLSAPVAFSKQGGSCCAAPAATGEEAKSSGQESVGKETSSDNMDQEESEAPVESSEEGIEELAEDEWEGLPQEPR